MGAPTSQWSVTGWDHDRAARASKATARCVSAMSAGRWLGVNKLAMG